MNLIIDIGNTRIKVAMFAQNELTNQFVFDSEQNFFNENLFEKFKPEHCIIGTVVNEKSEFIAKIKCNTNTFLFTSETKVPIINLYSSSGTLGSDRLAGAVGANYLFPDRNVLVIDCGTCIKYNFVNSKNEFIGGAISPGLTMRLKAMNHFTSRLPNLEVEENFEILVGTNTKESLLSGAIQGALLEVEGFIEQYQIRFPDLTIVMTGGDCNLFAKRLKKRIFALPNLILMGLNRILQYNIES